MILGWMWTLIITFSILFAVFTGHGNQLSAATAHGAQAGITATIGIAGSICLWSGVGNLMDKTGVTGFLGRLLKPLLKRIFPSAVNDHQLQKYLSGNICANILGLGNAATPMGIKAVQQMRLPSRPQIATDEMCRLIVLNTASIQLIPANVAAIRASLGSAAPFDILGAVWLTSLSSAAVGLMAACLMGKLCKHD